MNRSLLLVALAFGQALAGSAWALTIQLDYTYDTNGFFSGANVGRRTYLQAAAATFSNRLTDDLLSITPGSGNTWTAQTTNPGTGAALNINNLTVGADTVIVFVGARELGTTTLGIGGPGGFSASGTQAWLDRVDARGENGALSASPTDFGPWGGALTFDLTTNWYFDSDVTTMESIGSKSDFYSVAVHELGHLLGIGTAGSWDNLVSGGTFHGANSDTVYGGAVPVDSGAGHWANGVTGHLEGKSTVQEAAMDPSLTDGTRKYFTDLDYAGLRDVGWQVSSIPEPGSGALVLCGAAWLVGRRRRRRAGGNRQRE